MSFSSFANVIRWMITDTLPLRQKRRYRVCLHKGTYEKCTWTKDDIESPARYFDEDGNEITINQGKTWVCVVYDTKEDQIVIE